MLTFSEIAQNMLNAWPVWLFITLFVVFFWKTSKLKRGGYGNAASNAIDNLNSMTSGVPDSCGMISPLYLSNQSDMDRDRREQYGA
jgi:hypothetical protein